MQVSCCTASTVSSNRPSGLPTRAITPQNPHLRVPPPLLPVGAAVVGRDGDVPDGGIKPDVEDLERGSNGEAGVRRPWRWAGGILGSARACSLAALPRAQRAAQRHVAARTRGRHAMIVQGRHGAQRDTACRSPRPRGLPAPAPAPALRRDPTLSSYPALGTGVPQRRSRVMQRTLRPWDIHALVTCVRGSVCVCAGGATRSMPGFHELDALR
jgi:hypothetical protein